MVVPPSVQPPNLGPETSWTLVHQYCPSLQYPRPFQFLNFLHPFPPFLLPCFLLYWAFIIIHNDSFCHLTSLRAPCLSPVHFQTVHRKKYVQTSFLIFLPFFLTSFVAFPVPTRKSPDSLGRSTKPFQHPPILRFQLQTPPHRLMHLDTHCGSQPAFWVLVSHCTLPTSGSLNMSSLLISKHFSAFGRTVYLSRSNSDVLSECSLLPCLEMS